MQRIGSRAQVMHGNAKMTGGGLKKKDLKYNKQGKIVSKKMSAMAKKEKRLQKAGYITKKGQFGAVRVMRGGEKKQFYLYFSKSTDREYTPHDTQNIEKLNYANISIELQYPIGRLPIMAATGRAEEISEKICFSINESDISAVKFSPTIPNVLSNFIRERKFTIGYSNKPVIIKYGNEKVTITNNVYNLYLLEDGERERINSIINSTGIQMKNISRQ